MLSVNKQMFFDLSNSVYITWQEHGLKNGAKGCFWSAFVWPEATCGYGTSTVKNFVLTVASSGSGYVIEWRHNSLARTIDRVGVYYTCTKSLCILCVFRVCDEIKFACDFLCRRWVDVVERHRCRYSDKWLCCLWQECRKHRELRSRSGHKLRHTSGG